MRGSDALAACQGTLSSTRSEVAIGLRDKGIELEREARERAEALRSVFEELATLLARKAAEELNARAVPTPAGGKWHATQVIRVRQRLAQ